MPIDNSAPDELAVFYNSDRINSKVLCNIDASLNSKVRVNGPLKSPTAKRTFRLAITASGEYSQDFGGSPYSTTNVLKCFSCWSQPH